MEADKGTGAAEKDEATVDNDISEGREGIEGGVEGSESLEEIDMNENELSTDFGSVPNFGSG